MRALVTKVISPGGRHSNCKDADTVAILVMVGEEEVPCSLAVKPGRLHKGQVIDVVYADPRNPELGFRVA